jgi:DNA invertase Pin-like site-specific DNA recombinase
MKIALYARVSKNCVKCGRLREQHKGADHDYEGQNPEVQLRILRAWCEQHDHKIVVEYVDHLTGKNTKRPELQRLMTDLTKGLRDVDAVLVWKLDRFGRSQRDLLNLVEELAAAKVSFVSLTENFDLTTPMGKAMFGLLAVFAELERNNISERTKAGLALARAEGRRPGPKIDPRKGPSRWTINRRRNRGEAA